MAKVNIMHRLVLNYEEDPVVLQLSDDQEDLPEWDIVVGELAIGLHQRQLAAIVHQFLEALGYKEISDMLDLRSDEEDQPDPALVDDETK